MNKKLIAYILIIVGALPILMAIYAVIQGMIIYILNVTYAGFIPTFLYTLIAIGFTMCIPLGVWLLSKEKK